MPGPILAPSTPSPRLIAPAIAASAATACFVAGLAVAASVTAAPARPADRCALPDGFALADLPERDRSLALRHALACRDLEHGRIGPDEFRARVAAPAPDPAPAPIHWATTVRDVSSQYGTPNWAATRALGAPDVWPSHGDHVGAWAPLAPDAGPEHLEVGFDAARRLSGLTIYETFNPGAVTRVELITEDGRRLEVHRAAPAPLGGAHRREIAFPCTADRIAAVRITLDTAAVPGWNELDAIGAVACGG